MENDKKRIERLAESLRDNLKKRKVQRRAKVGKNDFIAPSDSEIPTYQSLKDQIKLRCSII